MVTGGEIAAMNRALAAQEAFEAKVWAAQGSASFLANLTNPGRMLEIANGVHDNTARFYQRRDELVEQEPTDHEAILAFVDGIAHATGTDLARAMAAETEAKDPAKFMAGLGLDVWSQLKGYVPLVVVVLLAVVFGPVLLAAFFRPRG